MLSGGKSNNYYQYFIDDGKVSSGTLIAHHCQRLFYAIVLSVC